MYEPPRPDERPGCRDTLIITRAVFAVILPPLAVLIVVAGLIALAVVLYVAHPALALLPIAAGGLGVYLFARWERRNVRPPER